MGVECFGSTRRTRTLFFCDKRTVPRHEYYKNRYIEISPDVVCDFTNLPFEDKSFKLVVFDPPHLAWTGENSWLALKYGRLEENWPQMLHDGFHECMRVLDDYGTLIFKWSEVQIPLAEILKAIRAEPLFGHRSGKNNNTHWLCFMKFPKDCGQSRSQWLDKLLGGENV